MSPACIWCSGGTNICVLVRESLPSEQQAKRSPKKSMAAADEGPSYESATRDVLLAAGKVIGATCVDANLAYAQCKAKNSDPEACLKLAGNVAACTNDALQKIDKNCGVSFEKFRECMDRMQMRYNMCHKYERVFTACIHGAK